MIAYLDTHVLVWLMDANLKRITPKAQATLNLATLLVSPIVLLELEYLYEIERTSFRSRDVQAKMRKELGIEVCDLPFGRVTDAALDENWTRDPFDRLIVAQAKANGLTSLITADERMREHYPMAIW